MAPRRTVTRVAAVTAAAAAPAPGRSTLSLSAKRAASLVPTAAGARGPAHMVLSTAAMAPAEPAEPGGLSEKVYDALDNGFGSILLLAATAASLILANSAMSGEYLHFWHMHIGPVAAGLHMSIHEWVNEVGRCRLNRVESRVESD